MLLLSVLGAALLGLAVADVAITSFALQPRGGPLTARLSAWIWAASRRAVQRSTGSSGGVRIGPRILLAVVLAWLLLSWLGWFLVFSGVENAVVEASSGEPASVAARLYYAGFSVFTLGIGDYRPQGAFWQVATAVAAAQGFFVLTLSVTYVLPVVSAVTQKRATARAIRLLGDNPTAMAGNAWNGRDFGHLPVQLIDLSSQLLAVQEKHYAYPVLHYFVSSDIDTSLPSAVAQLDEALLLWSVGVAQKHRPDASVVRGLRDVVGSYLAMLEHVHIRAAQELPPLPALDHLRSCGVPVVSDREFRQGAATWEQRRRLLRGLVERDGWRWDDLAAVPERREGSDEPTA